MWLSHYRLPLLPRDIRRDPKVDFIQAMQVLRLEKDDIVVMKSPDTLSEAVVRNIIETVKKVLGTGVKVMILEQGMDIGVLHKEPIK
jgi:hypothetical protein